jgi:hypothetical protein
MNGRSPTIHHKKQKRRIGMRPLLNHLLICVYLRRTRLHYCGGAILLLRSSLATTPSLMWTTR